MTRRNDAQPASTERRTRDERQSARAVWALGTGVFLVILLSVGSASAAVRIPTKFTDSADGVCDGDCSLREAILASSGDGVDDEIWLPNGVFTLTIANSGGASYDTGDLNISSSDSLKIIGQGPGQTTIDATGLGDRVLHVASSGALIELEGLTVTGGSTSESGGGIYHESGHLVLSNVVVRNNQATGAGGGVHSYLAELTVQDGSVIRDNSAGATGGGLTGTDLTVTDSTVWGNQATGSGGAIDSGGLTVSGSTIAYNTSEGVGGGGIKVENAGQVTISNSTLVGNHAGAGSGPGLGGAILVQTGTTLTLNSVTVSGNSSDWGGSLHAVDSTTITLINTLISGSCATSGSGTLLTSGGNLESPGDTCNLASGGTDQYDVADPMLFPLDSYGGPTQTMLPRPGSPALGGGDDGYCLAYDQRGELRGDGQCDVGAVERQPTEPDPIFVDGFESGATSAW